MDTAKRQPRHRLSAVSDAGTLVRAARHGFYELVALIERLAPDAIPVGGAGPPREEAIFFRHDPALTFSASEVASVSLEDRPPAEPAVNQAARPRYEITTTFLGLTGAVSPLPDYFVEDLLSDESAADRDFLDIFHHRLLSLLYRLVRKYDVAAELDSTGWDAWSRRILALAGTDAYGEEPGGHESLVAAPVLRRLAPLLATGARNARTLTLVLEEVLGPELGGASIVVDEFIGAWVDIEDDQRTRLGQANHRLGRSFVLGRRVFDPAAKFRVRIGPAARAVYDRLRPPGDLFAVVKDVVALVVGDRLSYELEITLATEAVSRFILSARGVRLGQNSWLAEASPRDKRVVVDVVS